MRQEHEDIALGGVFVDGVEVMQRRRELCDLVLSEESLDGRHVDQDVSALSGREALRRARVDLVMAVTGSVDENARAEDVRIDEEEGGAHVVHVGAVRHSVAQVPGVSAGEEMRVDVLLVVPALRVEALAEQVDVVREGLRLVLGVPHEGDRARGGREGGGQGVVPDKQVDESRLPGVEGACQDHSRLGGQQASEGVGVACSGEPRCFRRERQRGVLDPVRQCTQLVHALGGDSGFQAMGRLGVPHQGRQVRADGSAEGGESLDPDVSGVAFHARDLGLVDAEHLRDVLL
ncbi:hypothetical protein ON003_16150 [Janibacter hoylei]|nr:hypothetical protein [Janibacter hoylei]MCW4602951.1 hypothetical protein [Janibacter hoylei]